MNSSENMAPRVLFAFLLTLATGLFYADNASAESKDLRTVILIVPSDQQNVLMSVIRAVQSQLSDLDVVLKLHSLDHLPPEPASQLENAEKISTETGALAVFWFDISIEGQGLLYIASEGGGQIVLRRIVEASEEGRAEALAVIVRGSVKELLMTGKLTPSPPEHVSSQAEPPPLPTPEMIRNISINIRQAEPLVPESETYEYVWLYQELAYALYVHSAEHPAIHGLNVSIGFNVVDEISLIAGYTVQEPLIHDGDTASIQLQRHPIHFGIRTHFNIGVITIGGALPLIIDYANFENTSLAANMISVRDDSDVIFGLMPRLEIGYRIIDRLRLVILAGAEISLNARHYVSPAPVEGEEEVLLDSWQVQPWLLAGFWVDII